MLKEETNKQYTSPFSLSSPSALHELHHLVALRSCLCGIWHRAGGQSHKPWEKQSFVHIRLQSIRFPLPPQLPSSVFLRPEGYLQRASASLPFLIRSAACCQYFFHPAGQWSISLLSDETNRWILTTLQSKWTTGPSQLLPRRLPQHMQSLISIMSVKQLLM